MHRMVYMMALAAFVCWVWGVFYYHETGIFHFFLVIAVVSLILAVVGGDRLFRYKEED